MNSKSITKKLGFSAIIIGSVVSIVLQITFGAFLAQHGYAEGVGVIFFSLFSCLTLAFFAKKYSINESHESAVDEIKRYREEYAEQGNEETPEAKP